MCQHRLPQQQIASQFLNYRRLSFFFFSIVSVNTNLSWKVNSGFSPTSVHAAVTGRLYSPTPIIWKHSSKVALTSQKPPFLSPLAAMHLPAAVLLLLLLHSAESRRGAPQYGARGRAWGAGRVRRQAQECKEYIEAGEKYLDCQDQQLTTVMQDWPTDIQHLLLARNKIQVTPVSMNMWKCSGGRKMGSEYQNG